MGLALAALAPASVQPALRQEVLAHLPALHQPRERDSALVPPQVGWRIADTSPMPSTVLHVSGLKVLDRTRSCSRPCMEMRLAHTSAGTAAPAASGAGFGGAAGGFGSTAAAKPAAAGMLRTW